MHKSLKNSPTVFYKPMPAVSEIRSGYLYKSPPHRRIVAGVTQSKLWKKRYFILFKISDREYHFKYFRNKNEKERPLGGIDLSQISVLQVSPQHHTRWTWIQKSFKCSPSCVLYIRTADRDYFLVGENSEEVDGWFSDLYDSLENRPHTLLNSQEASGNKLTIETISPPIVRQPNPADVLEKDEPKMRSMSDPSSNILDGDTEKSKREDNIKRPTSEPVNPVYDYPRPVPKQKALENGARRRHSIDSLYENMGKCREHDGVVEEEDTEVEELNKAAQSTLMRTVNQAFDKMKTQISPPPKCTEEPATEDREETQPSSDFSSSSSDNDATSPIGSLERPTGSRMDKRNSADSIDHVAPDERNLMVNMADVKKHLTLTDVDGKPCVSGWTGQPQSVCLFHKGDNIVAVNDLHTGTVEEFNLYISKSLKAEVKLTILRLPGCQPLHSLSCYCTDYSTNN
ncbi:pleckstrin homology domain-containing family S member 1-like isoform X2 [Mugil cephalus]|uniref:pleckstrin homology domain-containing family S member 1-like isoform X2 n=1 Tax=Mugil cephalus TaxID=48193 RepID=UPI001FB70B30|nr:pleckstrin homology domain-containing family S member 1-like isoform X2 [Mugil cephalus]